MAALRRPVIRQYEFGKPHEVLVRVENFRLVIDVRYERSGFFQLASKNCAARLLMAGAVPS